MQYNEDKVDEIVLALLCLTTFKADTNHRAWKSLDWNVMDRLYKKGYISNPQSKAKSIVLSEEGVQLSRGLFEKYFKAEE